MGSKVKPAIWDTMSFFFFVWMGFSVYPKNEPLGILLIVFSCVRFFNDMNRADK
jgi:hypothetical protein